MTEPQQIPHLIKLLDDESPEVREAVAKLLEAFGISIKVHMTFLILPLLFLGYGLRGLFSYSSSSSA